MITTKGGVSAVDNFHNLATAKAGEKCFEIEDVGAASTKTALVHLAPFNVSDAYWNEKQPVSKEEQWLLFAY